MYQRNLYQRLDYNYNDYPYASHRCTRLQEVDYLLDAASGLGQYGSASTCEDIPAALGSFLDNFKRLPACCQSYNSEDACAVLAAFETYYDLSGADPQTQRHITADLFSEQEEVLNEHVTLPDHSWEHDTAERFLAQDFEQDLDNTEITSYDLPALCPGEYHRSLGSELPLDTVSEAQDADFSCPPEAKPATDLSSSSQGGQQLLLRKLDAARPPHHSDACSFDEAIYQVLSIRQSTSEAVPSYAHRLQPLQAAAPSLPSELLHMAFLGGLLPEIQQQLSRIMPLDDLGAPLHVLVDAAILAEADLPSRQACLQHLETLHNATCGEPLGPDPQEATLPHLSSETSGTVESCAVQEQLPSPSHHQPTLDLQHRASSTAEPSMAKATEASASPSYTLTTAECDSPSLSGLPPADLVASKAVEPTDMPPTLLPLAECLIIPDIELQQPSASVDDSDQRTSLRPHAANSPHDTALEPTLHCSTTANTDTLQILPYELGSLPAMGTSIVDAFETSSICEATVASSSACQDLYTAASDALQDGFMPLLLELPAAYDITPSDPFHASIALQPSLEPAFFSLPSTISRASTSDPFAASLQCPPTFRPLPSPLSPESATSSTELMPFSADECLSPHSSHMPHYMSAVATLPALAALANVTILGKTCAIILPRCLDANQIIADELPQPTDKPPPLLPSFELAHGGHCVSLAVTDEFRLTTPPPPPPAFLGPMHLLIIHTRFQQAIIFGNGDTCLSVPLAVLVVGGRQLLAATAPDLDRLLYLHLPQAYLTSPS